MRLFGFIVIVAFGFQCLAEEANKLPAPDKVAEYLQAISVTIQAKSAEGSGVIKTRIVAGKRVNFVWTAAHVIDDLRTVEEVVDPKTGTKRQKVTFKDCNIVKELVEEGRRVGELKMTASVLKYSKDEDLAILRIQKRDFVDASVVFYLEDTIPSIGTDLYHVGSLLGQFGSNSMTSGIVSQIGRMLDKKEFDQATTNSFPGSSGGGVYLKNGQYVGCLVRGAGESFSLMVPVRRIRKWADSTGLVWLVDDTKAPPSEADIEKIAIEDIGATFTDNNPAKSDFDTQFPKMIRPIQIIRIAPPVDSRGNLLLPSDCSMED